MLVGSCYKQSHKNYYMKKILGWIHVKQTCIQPTLIKTYTMKFEIIRFRKRYKIWCEESATTLKNCVL